MFVNWLFRWVLMAKKQHFSMCFFCVCRWRIPSLWAKHRGGLSRDGKFYHLRRVYDNPTVLWDRNVDSDEQANLRDKDAGKSTYTVLKKKKKLVKR